MPAPPATSSSSTTANTFRKQRPLLLLSLSFFLCLCTLLPSSTQAFSAPSPRANQRSLLPTKPSASSANKPSSSSSVKKQPPPPPSSKSKRPTTAFPSSNNKKKKIDELTNRQIYPPSFLPPKIKPTTLLLKDSKRGLYVFEQPFILGVIDVKNRMSILRLSDGGFVLFSPLAATEECITLVQDLIKQENLKTSNSWILAPSTYPEHHESLATWREVFPEARIVSVHPRVNVIAEYLLEGSPSEAVEALPQALRKDLEVGVLQTPLLREMILCHKPSRTLFVADSGFFINDDYTNSVTKIVTQIQGIYNRFVTPPFFRLGVNKAEGKRLYERVKGWGFDKIVTCHAALVEEGKGKEAWIEGYKHLA